jgi:hypothetical protein
MRDGEGCKLRYISRLTTAICITAVCIGCLFTVVVKSASSGNENHEQPPDVSTVTIFLTGDVLGELKPCGCASGQLGGLDRRTAIFEEVAHDRRLVIDTGNFIGDQTEQDIIKFDIIMQSLAMLGYDIINLTENDIRIAQDLGLLEGTSFDIITHACDTEAKVPPSRARELQVGDRCLLVAVASAKAGSRQIDFVQKLFPTKHNGHDGPILNILITDNCQEPFIEHISDMAVVDVLICPASADEPVILDGQREKPLVLTVGRLGKYVGRLTVRLGEERKLQLDYTKVPVDEQLPADEQLAQLYKEYQLMVKEENLLEKVIKVPLPEDMEYLGSTSCGFGSSCHQYEYEKWSEKEHAKAYQTLVDVGSQYDPECIKCHVVGLDYETGFVSEKSPKDLRNVGCEVCHGPGSKHMMAILMAEEDTETSEPKSECIDCHTSEHSNYEGREEEYLRKIVHWKEPKQDTDVKK